MNRIEIASLYNGSHRNQKFNGVLPDGWAVDINNLCVENFPFGEVEAEEVNGVMTVTKWTAGTMPEPTPEPESEPTLDERVTELEDALAESDAVAMSLYENFVAQEAINTEQDEAILGLYELMGG